MSLLLTLNIFYTFFIMPIVNFCWLCKTSAVVTVVKLTADKACQCLRDQLYTAIITKISMVFTIFIKPFIVSQIKTNVLQILILIFIYFHLYHYVSQWWRYLLQLFQSLTHKKRGPNRHLLFQSQPWKHQNNKTNLDIRRTSMTLFWCLYC